MYQRMSNLFLVFIPSYPLNDAAETVNEIESSIGRVMGGTSGILYFPLLVFA